MSHQTINRLLTTEPVDFVEKWATGDVHKIRDQLNTNTKASLLLTRGIDISEELASELCSAKTVSADSITNTISRIASSKKKLIEEYISYCEDSKISKIFTHSELKKLCIIHIGTDDCNIDYLDELFKCEVVSLAGQPQGENIIVSMQGQLTMVVPDASSDSVYRVQTVPITQDVEYLTYKDQKGAKQKVPNFRIRELKLRTLGGAHMFEGHSTNRI